MWIRPLAYSSKINNIVVKIVTTVFVLNMQLKQLEDHQLVTKKIYPQLPPKVEYSLTSLGESLIPIITKLGKWGDENQEQLRTVIENNPNKQELSPEK